MSKIKRFRIQEYKKHGLTQELLSEKTGAAQSRISAMARSERQVFVERLGDELRIVDREPRIIGRDFEQAS